MPSKEELFAELYSGSQQRLFGYVLGLVRNTADAQDILQQTAITAWKKFDDFAPNTSFIRWVVTIARYETMNFVKYRRRSRIYFNQDLVEQLGENVCKLSCETVEDRDAALSKCLSKISASDRKLIECRYTHGLGSMQIAEVLDRSQASICNSLRRVRESLLRCVERTLAKEDMP